MKINFLMKNISSNRIIKKKDDSARKIKFNKIDKKYKKYKNVRNILSICLTFVSTFSKKT